MKLHYLNEINSTNSFVKEHISELENCTVVYTFKQTAGRGRFDRKWVDLGEGNIFLSIVLKPSSMLKPVYSNLTQYTSLKLVQVFCSYGLDAKIKWPNDILINSKKISGILAETIFKENLLKGIVIGVGLNLNADKNDFVKIDKSATSLNLEIGKKVDKMEFFNKFIANFEQDYDLFLQKGFLLIKNEYENYIDFLGKEISIINLGKSHTGIAEKITNNGAIVINNQEFLTGDIL